MTTIKHFPLPGAKIAVRSQKGPWFSLVVTDRSKQERIEFVFHGNFNFRRFCDAIAAAREAWDKKLLNQFGGTEWFG